MRGEEQHKPIYMLDEDGRLVPTKHVSLFPELTERQMAFNEWVGVIYLISSLIAVACLPTVVLVVAAFLNVM